MKNKFFLTILIVTFTLSNTGFSQSLKSKSFSLDMPSYASLVKPEDVKTYSAELALGSGEALNFTNAELKQKLVLEDFTKAPEGATPDLFFAIDGISRKDLEIRGTLAPATADSYSLQMLPKKKAKISIAVLVNGEVTHIWERGISFKTDGAGAAQPFIIDFSVDDKDKYLVMLPHSDQPFITQYAIEKFLDKSLGESYLENKLIPAIKETYDNSLKKIYTQFYFIKDKKDKEFSKESKAKLESFKELALSKFSSLKYLRENKNEIIPFVTYWELVLDRYPNVDKNSEKAIWGISMNLHQAYLLLEDFENARKYMNKAVSIGHKKNYTKTVAKDLDKTISLYFNNFNGAKERKYSSKYEKNDLAKYATGN